MLVWLCLKKKQCSSQASHSQVLLPYIPTTSSTCAGSWSRLPCESTWFNFQLIEELIALLAGMQGASVRGGAKAQVELGSTGCALSLWNPFCNCCWEGAGCRVCRTCSHKWATLCMKMWEGKHGNTYEQDIPNLWFVQGAGLRALQRNST